MGFAVNVGLLVGANSKLENVQLDEDEAYARLRISPKALTAILTLSSWSSRLGVVEAGLLSELLNASSDVLIVFSVVGGGSLVVVVGLSIVD